MEKSNAILIYIHKNKKSITCCIHHSLRMIVPYKQEIISIHGKSLITSLCQFTLQQQSPFCYNKISTLKVCAQHTRVRVRNVSYKEVHFKRIHGHDIRNIKSISMYFLLKSQTKNMSLIIRFSSNTRVQSFPLKTGCQLKMRTLMLCGNLF